MNLSPQEKKVRSILIKVAAGKLKTFRPGLIGYKELWNRATSKKWGRGKVNELVKWILNISVFEFESGRGLLNEIVVGKATGIPREPIPRVKDALRLHGIKKRIPFHSHQEAQAHCWKIWRNKAVSNEDEVEEGAREDKISTFVKRNRKIIEKRKRQDGYTCQACGFKIQVHGKYIMDCHHIYPLGFSGTKRVTSTDDLVSLCPTCHRIAHTRKYPLDLNEIKLVRKKNKKENGASVHAHR